MHILSEYLISKKNSRAKVWQRMRGSCLIHTHTNTHIPTRARTKYMHTYGIGKT